MDRRAAFLIAATAALSPVPAIAAAPSQILFAQGQWAAVRYGDRCEAVARPLLPAARRQPRVGRHELDRVVAPGIGKTERRQVPLVDPRHDGH